MPNLYSTKKAFLPANASQGLTPGDIYFTTDTLELFVVVGNGKGGSLVPAEQVQPANSSQISGIPVNAPSTAPDDGDVLMYDATNRWCSWRPSIGGSKPTRHYPNEATGNGRTSFSFNGTIDESVLMLFMNGELLDPEKDFTFVSTSSVVMAEAPQSTDSLVAYF